MQHGYKVESVSFPRDRGMTTTTSTARTLTVSSLYREWGQQHRKKECIVPSIRLNGKWLATLGFVRGQRISVVAKGTTITIIQLVDGNDLGQRTKPMNKSTKLIEAVGRNAPCHTTEKPLNEPTWRDTEQILSS